MAQKAVILCSNISAVADQPAVYYQGGRGVLIVEASTYATTCQLQTQSLSGKWVLIGTAFTADGAQAIDLPAGMYRVHLTGGSVSALYASLVSVAYQ